MRVFGLPKDAERKRQNRYLSKILLSKPPKQFNRDPADPSQPNEGGKTAEGDP